MQKCVQQIPSKIVIFSQPKCFLNSAHLRDVVVVVFYKCHVSHPPPRFLENRPVEMTARIETALQMVMSFGQGTIDLNTNDLEIMVDLVSRDPIGVPRW